MIKSQKLINSGGPAMSLSSKNLSALNIIRAVERLSEDEKETLAILADKKLSEELLKRRKEAYLELKKGDLLSPKDLFKEMNNGRVRYQKY
jgi:hypothetical protein